MNVKDLEIFSSATTACQNCAPINTILQIAYQMFRTRAITLLVVEFLARYGFDPRFADLVTKLPSPPKKKYVNISETKEAGKQEE